MLWYISMLKLNPDNYITIIIMLSTLLFFVAKTFLPESWLLIIARIFGVRHWQRVFRDFAHRFHQFSSHQLSLNPNRLALFISWLSARNSAKSTITSYISAISYRPQVKRFSRPHWFGLIRKLLTEVSLRRQSDIRLPISRQVLHELVRSCQTLLTLFVIPKSTLLLLPKPGWNLVIPLWGLLLHRPDIGYSIILAQTEMMVALVFWLGTRLLLTKLERVFVILLSTLSGLLSPALLVRLRLSSPGYHLQAAVLFKSSTYCGYVRHRIRWVARIGCNDS